MKTAIYAQRVLRVAKELATLAVEDDDPDIRRLARRDARSLLDIARCCNGDAGRVPRPRWHNAGRRYSCPSQ